MDLEKTLKVTGIVLLVIAVGMLQTTFSILEVKGITPNLMLILVFTLSFFSSIDSQSRWPGFLTAVGGGLLLDVHSGLSLGTEALMLIGVSLVVKQTLKWLDKVNFFVYLVLFSLLLILYQVVFNLLSFGQFIILGGVNLIYNLAVAAIVYSLCALVKILKER